MVVQVVVGLRAGPVVLTRSRELIGPLARVGLPLATAGLLVLAYARIDQILVFELVGAEEAGQYAAVYRILEQAHFLPLTVSLTLLPLISAAHPANPARVGSCCRRRPAISRWSRFRSSASRSPRLGRRST